MNAVRAEGNKMTDTGLPELPEGYFWRVRHHKTRRLGAYYGTFYLTDEKRLQVQLIHRKVTTHTRTEKRMFRTVTITDVDAREVELFTEDAQGTNPIAVRNAANRIAKQWARAKERDALVGDYPPKKFDVSERTPQGRRLQDCIRT